MADKNIIKQLSSEQSERMETINHFLQFMNGVGRKFFHTDKSGASFVENDNKVYFKDDYTEKLVSFSSARDVYDRKGFSHGSTIYGFLECCYDFIITGEPAVGISPFFGKHWGYQEDDSKTLVKHAREIGLILPDQALDTLYNLYNNRVKPETASFRFGGIACRTTVVMEWQQNDQFYCATISESRIGNREGKKLLKQRLDQLEALPVENQGLKL